MADFVAEDGTDARLARHDMSSIPDVGETIEIKGVDYTVLSRRWKSGRLAPSVTLIVRQILETVR